MCGIREDKGAVESRWKNGLLAVPQGEYYQFGGVSL